MGRTTLDGAQEARHDDRVRRHRLEQQKGKQQPRRHLLSKRHFVCPLLLPPHPVRKPSVRPPTSPTESTASSIPMCFPPFLSLSPHVDDPFSTAVPSVGYSWAARPVSTLRAGATPSEETDVEDGKDVNSEALAAEQEAIKAEAAKAKALMDATDEFRAQQVGLEGYGAHPCVGLIWLCWRPSVQSHAERTSTTTTQQQHQQQQ